MSVGTRKRGIMLVAQANWAKMIPGMGLRNRYGTPRFPAPTRLKTLYSQVRMDFNVFSPRRCLCDCHAGCWMVWFAHTLAGSFDNSVSLYKWFRMGWRVRLWTYWILPGYKFIVPCLHESTTTPDNDSVRAWNDVGVFEVLAFGLLRFISLSVARKTT